MFLHLSFLRNHPCFLFLLYRSFFVSLSFLHCCFCASNKLPWHPLFQAQIVFIFGCFVLVIVPLFLLLERLINQGKGKKRFFKTLVFKSVKTSLGLPDLALFKCICLKTVFPSGLVFLLFWLFCGFLLLYFCCCSDYFCFDYFCFRYLFVFLFW